MCCIQKDNAQEHPTMSQIVKRLKNLSAFQLLSEYARKDKTMKLGDTQVRYRVQLITCMPSLFFVINM